MEQSLSGYDILSGLAPALCIAKAFMLAFSRSPPARSTPYAAT
jgi:hypothetical protein